MLPAVNVCRRFSIESLSILLIVTAAGAKQANENVARPFAGAQVMRFAVASGPALPVHARRAQIAVLLASSSGQRHPKRTLARLEAMSAAQALGLAEDVDLEALKEDAVAWASQHGLVHAV